MFNCLAITKKKTQCGPSSLTTLRSKKIKKWSVRFYFNWFYPCIHLDIHVPETTENCKEYWTRYHIRGTNKVTSKTYYILYIKKKISTAVICTICRHGMAYNTVYSCRVYSCTVLCSIILLPTNAFLRFFFFLFYIF